jgi:GNAT superfamily N-acetyltransferase
MTPPRLRPAGPGDAEAVAAVLLASRAGFLPFAPLAHPPDAVRRWIAAELVPAQGVTVAEQAGHVLGFAAVSVDNGVGWLEQLYLAPGHTGQGLGTALLAAALAQLRAQGVDCVRLWCFQANTGARRFYEREGFVAVQFTDGQGNEEGCPDVLYQRHFRP